MNNYQSSANIKARFIAALLLLVFAMIPLIKSFHYHQDQQSAVFKKNFKTSSTDDVATFHAKCPICDYVLHKEPKYFHDGIAIHLHAKEFLISSLGFYQVLIYLSRARLFPLANSPPVG